MASSSPSSSFSLVITLLLVPFLFSSIAFSYSFKDIQSWCNQTPYPQPCEFYLTNHAFNKPIKSKSDFLKVSLQLALDRAERGQLNTHSIGPKCRNTREKSAWTDCIELYTYTIQRLNKTLDSYTKCTQTDTQTWVSTALTNLETCIAGFYELGVSDYILPLMSNNVTKLLSNALSLNKDSNHQMETPSSQEGFPTWVKPGDRKLLQSSSAASKANVVVAKDGSGKYTTVKAAVDAAPKSSSGRYVIYVKSGVYNEQVEVKSSNIMLVGDGIGKTIITGSKSVGGGSTTFNSATVGKHLSNFNFISYITKSMMVY